MKAGSIHSEFCSKLTALSDEKYREFSMRGIPCDRPFLGVRIPNIRKLVNELSPEDYAEFLAAEPVAIEEVIARGFVIAKLPYETMLEYFDSQVEYLDNWCTVDTFCAALRKTVRRHEAVFLDKKIESLLTQKNEFAVRTGIVCLLDFYVKAEYLQMVFDRVEKLGACGAGSGSSSNSSPQDGYYIKMALAWLIAECFIKFPDETFVYMRYLRKEDSRFDKWTFNKAISKICDSFRVDDSVKRELKGLRW